MEVKTIGIVGGGVVGQATARVFMEHAEVRMFDIDVKRKTHVLPAVLECDLIFVCLPTPQREGSMECNTDYLVEFFEGLRPEDRNRNYVIRSTVPVGFTRQTLKVCGITNLVHSPEFLTARCAVTDAHLPSRNIIGVPTKDGMNEAGYLLQELYWTRFLGVPVQVMRSEESELVKLTCNSFFATKVAFFNEVQCLAGNLGLDWERIMSGVLSDGRIAHSHTKVPGPDGKYGFGGTCLPKDTASLLNTLIAEGLPRNVLSAVLLRNVIDRGRV